MTTITNTAAGPRGFWANGALKVLDAGQSAEIDLSAADRKAAERTGQFAFADDKPVSKPADKAKP